MFKTCGGMVRLRGSVATWCYSWLSFPVDLPAFELCGARSCHSHNSSQFGVSKLLKIPPLLPEVLPVVTTLIAFKFRGKAGESVCLSLSLSSCALDHVLAFSYWRAVHSRRAALLPLLVCSLRRPLWRTLHEWLKYHSPTSFWSPLLFLAKRVSGLT